MATDLPSVPPAEEPGDRLNLPEQTLADLIFRITRVMHRHYPGRSEEQLREDVVQSTVGSLVRQMRDAPEKFDPMIEDPRRIFGWAVQVCIKKAMRKIGQHRRTQGEQRALTEEVEAIIAMCEAEAPAALDELLAGLEPTIERPLIDLLFFEELTADEAAARLSEFRGAPITPGKIRDLLKAIRRRLGN